MSSREEQARQASMEQTGLYGQDLEDFVDSMREAHPVDSEAVASVERESTVQSLGSTGVGGCAEIHDHYGFYRAYED